MVVAYFLDTSALVKRYVPEKGTAWIQALTAHPPKYFAGCPNHSR